MGEKSTNVGPQEKKLENPPNRIPRLRGQRQNENLVIIMNESTSIEQRSDGTPIKSLREQAFMQAKAYQDKDPANRYRPGAVPGGIAIFKSPIETGNKPLIDIENKI